MGVFTSLNNIPPQGRKTTFITLHKTVSLLLAVLLLLPSLAQIAEGSLQNLEEAGLEGSGFFARSQTRLASIDNAGSFSYDVPITIPSGRNGLEPSLTLSYSSQGGDDHDLFGYGWNIAIPLVERISRDGVEDLYATTSSSTFRSSLSGELVQIGNGNEYRAKTETGDFHKYTFANDRWTVTDKSGNRYSFGTTTASRMDDTTGNNVYRWMLDEVRDTNDNHVTYTYWKNDGLIYPASINYTGHSGTDGIFDITFATTTATSQVTKYKTGFAVTRNYVIDEIEVRADGQLARSYDLTYESLDGSERDVIKAVSETGYSADETTTMPAIEFTYGTGGTESWTADATYENTFPEGVTQTSGSYRDNGTRVVDINGDGLDDMVRFYEVANYDDSEFYSVKTVHINEGNGNWDVNADWDWATTTLPFTIYYRTAPGNGQYLDMGTRFADINGDGLVDLIVGHECPGSCNQTVFETNYIDEQNRVFLNTGSGWEETAWSGVPYVTQWDTDDKQIYQYGMEFADINGDGLADRIQAYYEGSSSTDPADNVTSEIWLSTGSGWEHATSLDDTVPVPFIRGLGGTLVPHKNPTGYRLLDVNDDGLIDALRSYDHEAGVSSPGLDDEAVYLNTGDGWTKDTSYSNSLPRTGSYQMFLFDVSGSDDQGFRVLDVNGDDLPDIVRADGDNTNTVWWNTGFDFTAGEGITVPVDFLDDSFEPGDRGVRALDINGDSLTDLVYAPKTGTTTGTGDLYANQRNHPPLLTTVDTREGGTITIDYAGYQSTQLGSIADMGSIPFTPVVVTDVTYNSGFGHTRSEEYTYEDAYFYFDANELDDRRYAGFGKVTKEDETGKDITYYHQGNGNDTASEEGGDAFAKIGFPYRAERTDLTDDEFTIEVTSWETTDLGNGATFVSQDEVTTLQFDGDTDHKDSAVGYTYSTSTGNVLTMIEYGEVSASTDGSFTDTANDKRTTTYTYASNVSDHIVGLPSSETVTNASSTKVKETKFYYDGLSYGSVTDGNLTKREGWIAGSDYVTTQTTYDSYGLPISDIDGRGATTSYAYDEHNLYVATTTNPLGQSETFAYDYALGEVNSYTNVAGQLSTTSYDGIGRVLGEASPDPQTGTVVEKTTYEYTDTKDAFAVEQTDYFTATTSRKSFSYLDGFGRTIQTRERAEDSNTYIVRDIVYGLNDLIIKETLPYFDTGSSRTSATSDNDLHTEYEFDALDRVVKITTAAGETDTAYDQWVETVTDALNNDRAYEFDAYGRLQQVTENNGTSTYDTTYAWNANDDLTRITDDAGNVRHVEYDGLSRRTKLEDLHAVSDTTFGSTTFAYDDNGNVTSRISPNADVTNWTYDGLNRQLTEDYTANAGTEVTYTYDSCTRGTGQLCEAVSAHASTTYAYNHAGGVDSESKYIDGTTYVTEYAYDWLGNQTLITYPDDSEVKYTYNAANQIETVEQRETTGSFSDIISNFDYGPHGQVTLQVYGNRATTSKIYDETELYRLQSITTWATSSAGTGGPSEEHALIEAELSGLLVENEEETTEADAVDEAATSDVAAAETEVVEEPVVVTLDPLTTETSTDPQITETSSVITTEAIVEATPIATSTPPQEEETPARPENRFMAELDGKSKERRIAQKADAILDTKPKGTYAYGDYTFQIEDIEKTDFGVEVFVRAWDKNDHQLGFGHDGSVDLERFRYVNPSVTVPDADGDIEVLKRDHETKDTFIQKYRLDPKERLLHSVAHTISVVGKYSNNIVPGKRGNTVTVFQADVIDGGLGRRTDDGGGDAADWSDDQSSATAELVDTSSAYLGSYIGAGWRYKTNNKYILDRVIFCFDTSTLGLDTINSATVSLYPDVGGIENDVETGADDVFIVHATPASTASLAAGDYDAVGDSVAAPTKLSTEMDIGAIASSQYNDFTLNATGEGEINKTGDTCLGMRSGDDITAEPSGSRSDKDGNRVVWESYEETGYGPTLTVDHSAAAYTASGNEIQKFSYAYDAVGNITEIVDNSITLSEATTTYTYDDLYRLKTASTSRASSSAYARSYSYNALGNITYKSDRGAYSYAGHIGSSFANPHAVTTAGSVIYEYDLNGNLASSSDGWTLDWDHQNRLIQSNDGIYETTYGYDHTGQRVYKSVEELPGGTGGAGEEHALIEAELSGLTVASGTVTDQIDEPAEEEIVRANNFETDAPATRSFPTDSVYGELLGKNKRDRIALKAGAIINSDPVGEHSHGDYRFEIESIKRTDYGVEVFVRAWDKLGKQLGFGRNGKVDLERFRFVNPSIAVPDPDGDIERLKRDPITDEITVQMWREDPRERLIHDVARTIALTAKQSDQIVSGKRGNTVTVYQADVIDGGLGIQRLDGTDAQDWDDAQASLTAENVDYTSDFLGANIGVGWRWSTGKKYKLDRNIICFDTDNLGSDTIDSATVSLYAEATENDVETGADDVYIVHATPASTASLVAGDYDAIGDSVSAPTYLSGGVDIGDLTVSDWNDFTLNATGEGEIDPDGNTCLGIRTGDDVTAEPSGSRSHKDGNRAVFESYEETSYGAALTIEHSALSGTTTTTHYVSSLYEVENGSSTKHIYAGDQLVASIDGTGAGALTYYNHLDHLNSTHVVTDGIGEVEELLAYYPFGMDRIDQSGAFDQTKRFTGHDFDSETDLTYMGARYYDGDTGRFTAQDPVSLAIGLPNEIREKTSMELSELLQHPQYLNSYSYTANNPIIYEDKNGEFLEISIGGHYGPIGADGSIRIGRNGISVAGTASGGAGLGVSGQVLLNDKPVGTRINAHISRNITSILGVGIQLGHEGEFDHTEPLSLPSDAKPQWAFGFGAEASADQSYTIEIPVFLWDGFDRSQEATDDNRSAETENDDKVN